MIRGILFSFLSAFLSATTVAQVVTSTASSGAGSLRDVAAAAAPNATITFDPSLDGQSILLEGSPITLTKNVNIDASGLSVTVAISGGGDSIFIINNGVNATLTRLTLLDAERAISNDGTTTINQCLLTQNSSDSFAGAILNNATGTLTVRDSTLAQNTAVTSGAAIFSSGILNVLNSTIANNCADLEGAGILCQSGTVFVQQSTISGNKAVTA
ncbi:MAG: hypothetical protein AAGJ79_08630, partial [Verrucomicrobiota bacterium]